MTAIKNVSSIPVGVGFGIKDAESAKMLASIADAIVVGSALIKLIEANLSNYNVMHQSIKTLLNSMRVAIDSETIKQEVA